MNGYWNRSRVYLGGNIEYTDGNNWRDVLSAELNKYGIITLDPTKKFFIQQIEETEQTKSKLIDLRQSGNYSAVRRFMKQVIHKDLRAIDISDFAIFRLEINMPTFGTTHELVVASNQSKPTLILIEDKSTLPLWLAGLVNSNYIFENVKQIMQFIDDVDSGKAILDDPQWMLLIPELR